MMVDSPVVPIYNWLVRATVELLGVEQGYFGR